VGLFRRNILLAGIFCLVSTYSKAGEKSVKFGIGYKDYALNENDKLIHSGRYFHGGYSYQFGNEFRNKVQFQISNSNRELTLDFPYVSAATAGNIYYDFNYRVITCKNSEHYIGGYLGNDYNLNFFPKIDSKNFYWENQTMIGLSSMNNINFKKSNRLDFNIHLPMYSTIIFNRMGRFDGEVPKDLPASHFSGFRDRLLNYNWELGYVFTKYGFTFGFYYQREYNFTSGTLNGGSESSAHSISLRIIY
jgi:hypothetical protein